MIRQRIFTSILLFVGLALVSLGNITFADEPRTLYIINGLGRTLSKLNLETEVIVNDFLTIGQWPNQILSFNDMLYVVNSGTNDIMIIDPRDDGQEPVIISLAQGSNPYYMAFVGANKAYVTNLIANSVSVVDVENRTILKDIPVGIGPQGILIVENQAFITNTGGYPHYSPSTVSIIDVLQDTIIQNLEVLTNPQNLALAPDGRIHVMCTGNYDDIPGCIVVIDRWAGPDWTPAVVDTIEIGGMPGDIMITPSGKGYCTSLGAEPHGHLYVYDAYADTVIRGVDNPIQVGYGAMRLLYDGQEDALWISNFGDDTVQKFDVDADTVLATYNFGEGAQDMAIVEPIMSSDPWADEVVSFTPGENWSEFGYNYFPNNVLGPPDPDPSINPNSPSCKPEELLSLGHGGEIILRFIDNAIVDGHGVDFTVFENAFISIFGTVFMEAGIVSVSQNGQNWYQFPYDTTDMSGLAGVTPTDDNLNPTDPTVSGGDHFDLADLGLEWATYVRITDLGDIYQEGLYNGDFDLDAIVAVNSSSTTLVNEEDPMVQPVAFKLWQNYPNPFNAETIIQYFVPSRESIKLTVFNLLGQKVRTLIDGIRNAGQQHIKWDGTDYTGRPVSSGIYFCSLKIGELTETRKMILIR